MYVRLNCSVHTYIYSQLHKYVITQTRNSKLWEMLKVGQVVLCWVLVGFSQLKSNSRTNNSQNTHTYTHAHACTLFGFFSIAAAAYVFSLQFRLIEISDSEIELNWIEMFFFVVWLAIGKWIGCVCMCVFVVVYLY